MSNSGRKWKLNVNSENSHVLEEIEALVRMVSLDDIAPGRHSALFALSIFGEFKAGRLNPFRLRQEITALESSAANGLKPPIQNRHPPLKGLWHKHYMQADLRSMAMNGRMRLPRRRGLCLRPGGAGRYEQKENSSVWLGEKGASPLSREPC